MPRRMGMMDYLMRRDGRNPYGSRGGYVTSRDPRRRDRAMRRDREYEEYEEDSRRGRDYNRYDDREHSARYGDSAYSGHDYERRGGDYERAGQYDRGSRYPFMVAGEFGRYDGHYDPYMDDEYFYDDYDYARGRRRDYGEDEEKLTRKEIDRWVEKLMKELTPDEKEMFKMDKVIKKASELGIKFDKFTEDEFYVTVLMFLTDYKETLGKSNMDMYIRLAKDFLCDEDAGVRYGEKLAMYYDNIVEG